MKQNIIIDTEDGKVKLQFEKCVKCEYHNFCYVTYGEYHKGVPNGLCEECLMD